MWMKQPLSHPARATLILQIQLKIIRQNKGRPMKGVVLVSMPTEPGDGGIIWLRSAEVRAKGKTQAQERMESESLDEAAPNQI